MPIFLIKWKTGLILVFKLTREQNGFAKDEMVMMIL